VSRRERDNDPAWDADDASQDVWLHALRGRYWQFPRGVAAKFLFRQAAEEARRARRTWRQARLLGVLRALLAGYWHLLPLLSPDDIDAS
jgi:DNA-directed RNA polymerase specialized sigma24 family protein